MWMKLLSQLFSETPIRLCGILQVVLCVIHWETHPMWNPLKVAPLSRLRIYKEKSCFFQMWMEILPLLVHSDRLHLSLFLLSWGKWHDLGLRSWWRHLACRSKATVLCAIKLVIFLHLTSKLWVRGSRSSQMDSINFSSILGIATGVWQHHV